MKNFITVMLFIFCVLVSVSSVAEAGKSGEKPNIVFLLADDMGWTDPGYMGSSFHLTPNIDALANVGMVFTNAYANAPNCAPTRACLMSGQYSPRHGVYTVGSSERGKSALRKLIPVENTTILSSDVVTIAEMLKEQGYACASMGKWHLGDGPTGPLGQGFDVNVGGNHAGHPRSYFSPYHNKDLPNGPQGEYLTDRLAEEAIRFIKKEKDNPFFLYLPFYAVHSPLQGKEELKKKYMGKPCDKARCNPYYAAMIESLDMAVGNILKTLDSLNLRRKTLVVFFSDNGPWFHVSTAEPLRGSKGMLYEGGIREPLIMSYPGIIKTGSSCEVPVIGLDLYSTFLELAGADPLDNQVLDGVSLVPLLKGKQIKERSLFWFFPAYLETYSNMKLVWRQTPANAIRKGDWKLIEYFEDDHIELYNLAYDIGETRDLSNVEKKKAGELLRELRLWRQEIHAPGLMDKNPEFDPELFKKALEEVSSGF